MEYLLLPLAYILGSIPFGLITGKVLKNVDVRQHGSKNIGTTNVMRIAGPAAAVLVLLLDLGKGAAVMVSPPLWGVSMEVTLAAGFLVVMGHCYSVFLKFNGGKGVATGLGVIVTTPGFFPGFVILLVIALLLIAVTRYVSLGSMTGAFLYPVLLALWGNPPEYIITASAIAVLVIWRHRDNIKRLLRGEESKLDQKIKVSGE